MQPHSSREIRLIVLGVVLLVHDGATAFSLVAPAPCLSGFRRQANTRSLAKLRVARASTISATMPMPLQEEGAGLSWFFYHNIAPLTMLVACARMVLPTSIQEKVGQGLPSLTTISKVINSIDPRSHLRSSNTRSSGFKSKSAEERKMHHKALKKTAMHSSSVACTVYFQNLRARSPPLLHENLSKDV
jgi:hypothetical protein